MGKRTHFGSPVRGSNLKHGAIMEIVGPHEVPWHHRPVKRILSVYGHEEELDFLTDDLVFRLQTQAQYFDVDTGRRVHRRVSGVGVTERSHALTVRVQRFDMISGTPIIVTHPEGWPLKIAIGRAKPTRRSFDAHIELQSCKEGCLRTIRPCDCGASWSGNDCCKYECSDHLWQTLTWEEEVEYEPPVFVSSYGGDDPIDLSAVPF